jgi:hypothetical protein
LRCQRLLFRRAESPKREEARGTESGESG